MSLFIITLTIGEANRDERSIVLRPVKNQGRVASGYQQNPHFRARRANVTGLGAWEAHVDELVLPKSVESSNISLNKAVVRRMSVYLK